MMRINITKALDMLLCVIVMLVTDLLFKYYSRQDISMYEWQRNISILSFIFIMSALLIIKKTYSILSLPALFIVLSYLFHFGQIIINGLIPGYRYSVAGNFIPKYADTVVKEALYYSFLTIQFVVIGIIVGRGSKGYRTYLDRVKLDISCKKTAYIVLLLSLPFKIVLTVAGMFLSYKYGYASASGIRLSHIKGYGIMMTLGNLYIIGIFLLLCHYRNYSRSFQKVYISACIIGGFSMLSGSRSKGVLDIVCFTSFYFLLNHKIDKRKVIKLFILCLTTGIIAVVLAETRMKSGGVGISNIFVHMIEMLKNNKIIGNILEELGGTVLSVLKVVEQENVYYTHSYGIDYIKGIIAIFPNLAYDSSKLLYTNYLNQNIAMGGSYIGELYYNFGKYSYVLGAGLGIAAARVYDCFLGCVKSKKYIYASCFVPVIYFLLFLPRDYLTAVYRPVVWGCLLVYFAYHIRVRHDDVRRSI